MQDVNSNGRKRRKTQESLQYIKARMNLSRIRSRNHFFSMLCIMITIHESYSQQQDLPKSSPPLSTTANGIMQENSSKESTDASSTGKNKKTSKSTSKIRRLPSSSSPSQSWLQDENATLLDIFGEVAKDVLTNRIIPDTEAMCDWHWMHLRCEPHCDCSYQPLWGDYHLGRSCRRREIVEFTSARAHNGANAGANDGNGDEGDGDASGSSGSAWEDDGGRSCELPPNTLVYKGMNGVRTGIKFIWRKLNWNARVRNVKQNICEFVSVDEFVEKDSDGVDGAGDGHGADDILGNLNNHGSGGTTFMEKPVRALLRKSFHCGEVPNPKEENIL